MLIATLISLVYKDGVTLALLLAGLVTLLVGVFIMVATKKHRKEMNKREGYIVVAFGWIVMSLSGTLPYLVTDAIPMTVESFGEVDGLDYETDLQAENINADVGGIFTIDLNFTVKAEGELSDDFQELESTVTFNGDLAGVITCTGEKQ